MSGYSLSESLIAPVILLCRFSLGSLSRQLKARRYLFRRREPSCSIGVSRWAISFLDQISLECHYRDDIVHFSLWVRSTFFPKPLPIRLLPARWWSGLLRWLRRCWRTLWTRARRASRSAWRRAAAGLSRSPTTYVAWRSTEPCMPFRDVRV